MKKIFGMIKSISLFCFSFIICIYSIFLGNLKNSKIRNQIKILNDNLQYEKSIAVLNEIITNEQSTHYEKYYAYLLESFTYKQLFNYKNTT